MYSTWTVSGSCSTSLPIQFPANAHPGGAIGGDWGTWLSATYVGDPNAVGSWLCPVQAFVCIWGGELKTSGWKVCLYLCLYVCHSVFEISKNKWNFKQLASEVPFKCELVLHSCTGLQSLSLVPSDRAMSYLEGIHNSACACSWKCYRNLR